MTSRYAGLVAALCAAVFDDAAVVPPRIRQATGSGASLPAPWTAYVAKVRDASYRITDDDIAALRVAGCTEEQVFEMTVAAATALALQRLDIGLRAMDAPA